MHINVRDILAESVGYSRDYKISGERPDFEVVRLATDLQGELKIARLDLGLLVTGSVEAALELECHRCLSTFTKPLRVSFDQLYKEDPGVDDLPIDERGEIDVAPLIEQELAVNVPIKVLCRPDCPGIQDVPENYIKEESGSRIADKARITKGNQRGRT